MIQQPIPFPKGKVFLFSLLFTSLSLFCQAQNSYFFELNPKSSSADAVDFTIDEVIDARVYTKHCGYVPNGVDGQLIPATFKNGIEKELAGLLKLMLKFGNTENEVVMVIKEFHINESNQSSDFGQFEMLYDFYLKKEDQYLPLLRVDDFQVTAGFNVKKSHCNNIVKSINHAVKTLANSNWQEKTKADDLVWQSRENLLDNKINFSILEKPALKAGIYRSYIEFKENNPSIQEVEITLKKAAEKDLFDRKAVVFKNLPEGVSPKDLSKKMWGFSDGKNVYINNWAVFQEYSFARLTSFGKYCPFIGKESLHRGGADRLARGDIEKKAYAFDLHKGQAYLMDEAFLEKILRSNSSLHHKYRQEQDKKNPNTKIWYAKELSLALSGN